MRAILTAVLRELLGLFVDDGMFAVAIIGWVVVFWLLSAQGSTAHHWSGPALFAGFAVLLVVSAVQRARK